MRQCRRTHQARHWRGEGQGSQGGALRRPHELRALHPDLALHGRGLAWPAVLKGRAPVVSGTRPRQILARALETQTLVLFYDPACAYVMPLITARHALRAQPKSAVIYACVRLSALVSAVEDEKSRVCRAGKRWHPPSGAHDPFTRNLSQAPCNFCNLQSVVLRGARTRATAPGRSSCYSRFEMKRREL